MSYLFAKAKAMWIVFWWIFASLVLWFPAGITGLVSRTGALSFRLCQVWMLVGKTIAFVKLEVVRTSEVDPSVSYIIVSNHQSLYDIPALMLGLGLKFRWVIKRSFLYFPFFGWGLYMAKHIFIDRSKPKQAIKEMDQAAQKLPPGVSVAVFPEGTRSDDGVVRDFKSGGFLMAIRNGIPILPVTVNGSWKVMPDKHSMSFHPGKIQVVVGAPIDTSEYNRKTMKDLIKRTRDVIVSNLDPGYPGP